MFDANNKITDEIKIRTIIDRHIMAIREKDVESMSQDYAPGVIMFSIAPPLKYTGSNKEATKKWFDSYKSGIECEINDVNITTSTDAAFAFYFYHIKGTQTTGDKVDMWVRMTLCFHKIADEWKITHEHQSVPFDMKTFKAELDLKP